MGKLSSAKNRFGSAMHNVETLLLEIEQYNPDHEVLLNEHTRVFLQIKDD